MTLNLKKVNHFNCTISDHVGDSSKLFALFSTARINLLDFKLFCKRLIILSIFIYVNASYASGIGINIPIGFGNVDYQDYEADMIQYGISIIYDTNVAKNKIFNYRLSLGLEYFRHKYEYHYYRDVDDYYGSYSDTHKGIRIISDHNFSFAVIKNTSFRVWMGPSLRFGFVFEDVSGVTLGLGITAIGLNYNIAKATTLSLETGYLLFLDYYSDDIAYVEYESPSIYSQYVSVNRGINKTFIIKVALIFRINDTYDIH
jgi:hypothetical protein